MQDKDRDLSGYRLSLAQETLANAKLCMDNQFYRDCINRSYYAAFYAIKAVLATESVDFKRHKDVIAYFNKNFVNTEIFPRNIGRKIAQAQKIREDSDYDDEYVPSYEKTKQQIETAMELIDLVEKYITEKIKNN